MPRRSLSRKSVRRGGKSRRRISPRLHDLVKKSGGRQYKLQWCRLLNATVYYGLSTEARLNQSRIFVRGYESNKSKSVSWWKCPQSTFERISQTDTSQLVRQSEFKSTVSAATVSSQQGLATRYRWGIPHNTEEDANLNEFRVFDNITFDESKPWFYELPNEISEQGGIRAELIKIATCIEKLITTTLLTLDLRFSPRANFFSGTTFNNVISLIPSLKFEHSLFTDVDYKYLTEPGENPVESVATFCSMVNLMKTFLDDSRYDYLLWLHREAHIANKPMFERLVENCKQFDVTRLWTPDRYDVPHKTDTSFRSLEVVQFTNSSLSYAKDDEYALCKNIGMMMKREVVIDFLDFICGAPPQRLDVGVNMFKKERTIHDFLQTKTYKIAAVFEQDEHPIKYLQTGQ